MRDVSNDQQKAVYSSPGVTLLRGVGNYFGGKHNTNQTANVKALIMGGEEAM